jgi:hypothetical protein
MPNWTQTAAFDAWLTHDPASDTEDAICEKCDAEMECGVDADEDGAYSYCVCVNPNCGK